MDEMTLYEDQIKAAYCISTDFPWSFRSINTATSYADRKTRYTRLRVETYGDGITYQQILKMRDLLGCEFNIELDYTDGVTTDAGTWLPGEQYIIFKWRTPDDA